MINNKHEDKVMKMFWALVCALMLTACNATGVTAENNDKPPVKTETPATPKTASDCAVAGGIWQRVGKAQMFACVLNTKDAGKSCTDSSQCESACIVKGTKVQPGQPAVGQCHSNNMLFGCRTYVKDGKAEHTLCVD